MSTLRLNVEYDVNENLVFDAYNVENEFMGTMTAKDGKISYITASNESYEFATGEAFNEYVDENGLRFKKTKERKWIEYNPNPQKKNTGDCSIRAYTKAAGITWEEAYDVAMEWGRKLAAIPDDHSVVHRILSKHFGYEYTKPAKGEKITVNQFAIAHKHGTYVLWVRGHVVTVVNGHYYDSWDSGNRRVYGIYQKL